MRPNPSFLIGHQSFADAFKNIKATTVKVTETRLNPAGLRVEQTERLLPDSQLGDYIDCVSGGCDAGVFIGDVWDDMVRRRETDRTVCKKCEGRAAWPTNPKCENTLEIKIHIDFKQ